MKKKPTCDACGETFGNPMALHRHKKPPSECASAKEALSPRSKKARRLDQSAAANRRSREKKKMERRMNAVTKNAWTQTSPEKKSFAGSTKSSPCIHPTPPGSARLTPETNKN